MKETRYPSKICQLLCATMTILGLALQTQAKLYPDMPTSGPTDQFPTNLNFSPFKPPVDPGVWAQTNTPEIAEWTRQNNPGDTMVLTGETLSTYTTEEDEGRDTRFVFYGEGVEADGLIQRLDGRQCAITLPENLPANDMYLLWSHNEYGFGEPAPINQTEAWWMGPDLIAAGEVFSIYGRNLDLGDGLAKAYIVGYGWVEAYAANPYKADFRIPEGLTNGKYSIYAHNGHGMEYGWSDPLTFEVEDKIIWNDDPATWFNVKDHGAVGDGVTDDTDAIQDAIDAANADGDWNTIYLPTGEYLVSAGFHVPSAQRMKGDGMDLTLIQASNDSWDSSTFAVNQIIAMDEYARTEGMEINKGNQGLTIIGYKGGGDKEKISVHDVRANCLFDGPNPETGGMANSTFWQSAPHVSITDSEFIIGAGMGLGAGRQLYISNCTFYGVGDINGMMPFSGSEMAMIDCYAAPYNAVNAATSTGWGKGRWMHGGGTINRLYIGGNSSTNMAPRYAEVFARMTPLTVSETTWYDPEKTGTGDYAYQTFTFSDIPETITTYTKTVAVEPGGDRSNFGFKITDVDYETNTMIIRNQKWTLPDAGDTSMEMVFWDQVDQNSGEQFMWETMVAYYRGVPSSVVSATVLEFDDIASQTDRNLSGYSFAIVEGKGMGQTSKIAKMTTTDGVVNLVTPLRVLPDETSICKLGKFMDRCVFYDNDLAGTSETGLYGVRDTATAGFNIYGAASRVIIDGNKIRDTEQGISLWAIVGYAGQSEEVQPVTFNTIKNNYITGTQYGLVTVVDGWSYDNSVDKTFFGNVFRGNEIVGSSRAAFSESISARQQKDMCVYENNLTANNVTTFKYNADAKNIFNQVLIENTFQEVGGEGVMSTHTNSYVIRDNEWAGFSSIDHGVGGAVLELPARVADIGSAIAHIPVWNSGTAPMSWTASSDTSWLNILTSEGDVSDEKDVNMLSFKVASPAPAEGSKAIITVMSEDQTRRITVVYTEGDVAITGSEYILSGLEGKQLKAELIQVSNDQVVQTLYPDTFVDPVVLTVSHAGLSVGEYLIWLYEYSESGWARIAFPGYPAGRDPILPIKE